MESLIVSRELDAIRTRTMRLIAVSVGIHLVAAVLLLNHDTTPPIAHPPREQLTEITWLSPRSATEIETASVPGRKTAPDVAAEPQAAPVTLADAGESARGIGDALAALRADAKGRRAISEAATADRAIRRTSVVGSFLAGNGRQAAEMARVDPPAGVPAPRRGAPIRRAEISVASIAAPAVPDRRPTEALEEISQQIGPGISLAGPVSDRALISYERPAYPDWAKESGVEVTVELLFTVLPDGRVKENIQVARTSGYRDFDLRAQSSLRHWRFENLGNGATGEQWGRIEFNYRLKQAG